MNRTYQTDYRLWALLSLPLFIGLGFVDPVPTKVPGYLWYPVWALIQGRGLTHVPGYIGLLLIGVTGLAALGGWFLQAAAAVCGFRLDRDPDPESEADYQDT